MGASPAAPDASAGPVEEAEQSAVGVAGVAADTVMEGPVAAPVAGCQAVAES